ncbi:uncharacterized protein LOC106520247 [Austrofundulus limnaeus]|uniref:Uncharacterized protein LOC106520247 n=1 Tax=Austrofundulus limnaeus TaxID=52670 RepID=A0A2I4BIX2_AUSLI|nr:PREDICTED: uncharacterized protein LOC106520247 [Austrofundulus limnaeus]
MALIGLFQLVLSTLLFVVVIDGPPPPANISIQAESGQDVPLTCHIPDKYNSSVKLSKVVSERVTVCLFRNGQFDKESQHPSFRNRVVLNDSNRNGEYLSLTLKNMTTADRGTYWAHGLHESTWYTFCVYILTVVGTGNPNWRIHVEDQNNKTSLDDGVKIKISTLTVVLYVLGGVLVLVLVFLGVICFKQHQNSNSLLLNHRLNKS